MKLIPKPEYTNLMTTVSLLVIGILVAYGLYEQITVQAYSKKEPKKEPLIDSASTIPDRYFLIMPLPLDQEYDEVDTREYYVVVSANKLKDTSYSLYFKNINNIPKDTLIGNFKNKKECFVKMNTLIRKLDSLNTLKMKLDSLKKSKYEVVKILTERDVSQVNN